MLTIIPAAGAAGEDKSLKDAADRIAARRKREKKADISVK